MSARTVTTARPAATAGFAALATMAVALTAGCGGNGEPAPAPAPPPAAALTINGTAATGAAIGGAAVSARCASGSAGATTAADGRYTISIAGGVPPCVVRVAPAGSAALHGLALGSSASVLAQITPLTQLLVGQATAVDPAAYFDAFDATAAGRLDATTVAAAQTSLRALLAAGGLDVAAIGDPLTATLLPGVAGDAYDAALLVLSAALSAAGTTLPDMTQAVVVRAAASATPSETASLPAELLLRPRAATCAALRSGRYRVITPMPGGALSAQVGFATFDAPTQTLTRANGSVGTWTANGNCRFTDTGGGWTADIVVTGAGVWYGRYSIDGGTNYRPLIALPEQAHAVAELAGAWQQAGMSQGSSGFTPFTGTTSFDAAGAFTAGTECRNDSTWAVDSCSTLTAPGLALFAPLQVNADGGFDIADAATRTPAARLLAYRAGGAYLMLVGVSDTGFSMWTPQAAGPAPAIGTVAYNLNVNIGAALTSPGTEFTTNTVTSIDPVAGSWTRTQQTVGASFSYQTTLFANRPREGLVFRPAATVTASDGTTIVRLNEFTFLRLHGMGISPVIIPAPRLMQFSGGVPAP